MFVSAATRDKSSFLIIAAPNNRHTEIAVAAAEHGKHIFTEKPIASTIADSKVMISECDKAGITLAVGHTYRRLNSHRFLKKMVDDGRIDKDETTVCYVTGNGLKATESIMQVLTKPEVMQADVAKISAVVR